MLSGIFRAFSDIATIGKTPFQKPVRS